MVITSGQIDTMMANVMGTFWDPTSSNTGKHPRIRPPSGGFADWGIINESDPGSGPWWMIADLLRLMTERCRAFPSDTTTLSRLQQQANNLVFQYGEDNLQSDGSTDGTIGASDDAGWKMQSYCDLHRITGDVAWLTRAKIAMPKILNRYKDPLNNQVSAGDGVYYSPFGILYTTPDPKKPQYFSASIEVGMVLAALYIYEQTKTQGFLNYAIGMAQRWTKSSYASDPGFQDTAHNVGTYFVEMNLAQGSISPRYAYSPMTMIDGGYYPFRNGGSPWQIQACFGIGAVCGKLYRLLGDTYYLDRLKEIIGALSSTSVYLINDGKFFSDRDPYSVGFFACEFVREALSLRTEGVDPNSTVRNGLVATAQYILSNPFTTGSDPNIYYSADWGAISGARNGYGAGDPSNPVKSHSWTEQGPVGTSYQDQAAPQQIMTTSMSAMMAMAGYLCGTLTGATITDGNSTITDNGHVVVDA